MSVKASLLDGVKRIALPEVGSVGYDTATLSIRHLSQIEQTLPCTIEVLRTVKGSAVELIAILGTGEKIVIGKKTPTSSSAKTATHILRSPTFTIEGDSLVLSTKAVWNRHPSSFGKKLSDIAEAARNSWTEALQFKEEGKTSPGFRPPQIGALHAVAAHWSISNKPALVVMPTGTGKTEVMLSCMVVGRPKRLLVLIPSDALRTQTINKFIRLGLLPTLGVLKHDAINPVVGVIKKTFSTESEIHDVAPCNVLISTVASIQGMPHSLLAKFLATFDTVFFDEAHHIPAISWERIFNGLRQQTVLQFTATPFRLDGRRIPGRIIYNFPLGLAQAQGYFRKIHFKEVYEPAHEKADVAVAERAVEQLRLDIATGYNHILLARAETRDQAERIFQDIYALKYSDLKPIIIHSKTPGRRRLLNDIRAGAHKIIVCVDMFGEGFDMPSLKIAALHSPHKSLAITLQFTGRFTRAASNLGDATLVANIADPKVSDAIEDLYAEDSDWNKLIPELSSKAIQSQQDFSEFLQRMVLDEKSDEDLFGLNVLHPKTSTVIFRAPSFNGRKFHKVIKKGAQIAREWHSKDKDLSIFITRSRIPIEWARIKEASDEIWDLFVLSYDASRHLLFIHSSQKGSLHQDIARVVSDPTAELFSGEKMFRAFHGVNRLIFHNVGLYNRGTRLRFRMYTGLDVGDAITPPVQTGSTKSNLFAVGYEDGQRTSIGVSNKGRIWSMSSSAIPDWRNWCNQMASKILDDTIPNNEFLRHTLIPEEIKALPHEKQLFFVSLPTEWYSSEMDSVRLLESGQEQNFHSFAITHFARTNANQIEMHLAFENGSTCIFLLSWGPTEGQFAVLQESGPTIEIQLPGVRKRLDEYFRDSPPTLFFIDGSEIVGARMLSTKGSLEFTFDRDRIATFDWNEVDLTVESKWKSGALRPNSIQAHIIEHLKTQHNHFVFDDDDSGEVADVVEIIEAENQEVLFRFYHCKFSGGNEPGRRVKDVYEVCAQAARSVRWAIDPQRLLTHLLERDGHSYLNGRPTRFEKGNSRTLANLKKRLRKLRTRYEVVVVQPGVSKALVDPEMATSFGSASAFITEITGSPMRVIASA